MLLVLFLLLLVLLLLLLILFPLQVELSNMYRIMEGTHYPNPESAIKVVLH